MGAPAAEMYMDILNRDCDDEVLAFNETNMPSRLLTTIKFLEMKNMIITREIDMDYIVISLNKEILCLDVVNDEICFSKEFIR